ncbi:putative ATP-dependent RNA helicase DHX35 [Papilio xuthus]|uniref:Putative ATP-dependent RNA helicase DHX35 n=1 Tax=Papilio xuthus TaxID=66420 RepID=A0A194Q5I9_PAPXU|nr:putative ATP-dependent RNA helicase DHX35 [Papilio xuthus]
MSAESGSVADGWDTSHAAATRRLSTAANGTRPLWLVARPSLRGLHFSTRYYIIRDQQSQCTLICTFETNVDIAGVGTYPLKTPRVQYRTGLPLQYLAQKLIMPSSKLSNAVSESYGLGIPEEILSALEILEQYSEENNESNKERRHFASGIQAANLTVLPMYGTLPHYRQIKVFQIADRNVRKVILATNIAETSVTIPGIVYVIDCGFHKLPYFEPAVGVQSVCITPISKNNAMQRAGRAGRTSRGKCYRLYTESQYEKLSTCIPPEMCRSDLSAMLLQLKALGIHNVLRFTFPTPPPAKSLLSGLETLYALSAVDRHGDLTSQVGACMAELPLNPMCAKMLCNSGEYGCIEEMLSIVSMLQVDGVFTSPATGKGNINAKISRRNNFEVAEGDIIMYLNIFDAYLKIRSKDTTKYKKPCKDWCQKMYINYRVMEKAYEIRQSLEKLIKDKFKMEDKTFEGTDLGTGKCVRVMRCVVSGLFPQAARLSAAGEYCGVRAARLHISPQSCLYHHQQPNW